MSIWRGRIRRLFAFRKLKVTVEQVKMAVAPLRDYHVFANEATKKGYSGTAILSKEKPISVSYGIGIEEHDNEGRVVCLQYNDFYLVNVYVPNSGNALLRLSYRMKWDKDFCTYLQKLEKLKPLLFVEISMWPKSIDLVALRQT